MGVLMGWIRGRPTGFFFGVEVSVIGVDGSDVLKETQNVKTESSIKRTIKLTFFACPESAPPLRLMVRNPDDYRPIFDGPSVFLLAQVIHRFFLFSLSLHI